MPDIASVLKQEIARLARREVRAETDRLKKLVAQQRGDIAQLKRRLAEVERQQNRSIKRARTPETPSTLEASATDAVRFSAKGLKAHRQRLDLTAAQTAKLLGVSVQTIYNWESGVTRPRNEQLAMIATLRRLGKRQLGERLAALG